MSLFRYSRDYFQSIEFGVQHAMGYMWADAFRERHLFYNHDSVIEFLLTGASSFGRTSPDDHFQKKGPLTFPCSVGSNISDFTNSIVLIEVNSLHSLSSQLSHIATLPLSLFFLSRVDSLSPSHTPISLLLRGFNLPCPLLFAN